MDPMKADVPFEHSSKLFGASNSARSLRSLRHCEDSEAKRKGNIEAKLKSVVTKLASTLTTQWWKDIKDV